MFRIVILIAECLILSNVVCGQFIGGLDSRRRARLGGIRPHTGHVTTSVHLDGLRQHTNPLDVDTLHVETRRAETHPIIGRRGGRRRARLDGIARSGIGRVIDPHTVTDHVTTSVHMNGPRQHTNPLDVPALHIEETHTNMHPTVSRTGSLHPGILSVGGIASGHSLGSGMHLDRSLRHRNPSRILHQPFVDSRRAGRVSSVTSSHFDGPYQHDNPYPFPVEHVRTRTTHLEPTATIPVNTLVPAISTDRVVSSVHLPLGPNRPRTTVHIDGPGVDGNPLDTHALHVQTEHQIGSSVIGPRFPYHEQRGLHTDHVTTRLHRDGSQRARSFGFDRDDMRQSRINRRRRWRRVRGERRGRRGRRMFENISRLLSAALG